MKKEVSPAVMWGVLIAVGLVVVVMGYRMLVPSTKTVATGSEDAMERIKGGGQLYEPSANAPVPRVVPTQGGGSGYIPTPPPR